MRRLITLLALAFLPQSDATLPPASAKVRLTATGVGVQIYHCNAQPGEPATFQWVFDSPEATLVDTTTRQPVGTHSAGPTWTWNDGSSITGTLLQKQPAPKLTAIPWLLLEAKPAGTTTGVLTDIAFIRRSNTQAGVAPSTGCDAQAAAESTTLRVPYAATYTFYTAAQ